MGNNLVLGWPKPIWFMVLGAHGSWWFQPIWKKYSSQGFAEDRVKRKILWNHHFLLIASVSAKNWLAREWRNQAIHGYDPGWNFLHSHIQIFSTPCAPELHPPGVNPINVNYSHIQRIHIWYIYLYIYLHLSFIYIYIYTVNISLSTKSILNIQSSHGSVMRFFDSPSSCLNFVLAIRNDTILLLLCDLTKLPLATTHVGMYPQTELGILGSLSFLGPTFQRKVRVTPRKTNITIEKPHF